MDSQGRRERQHPCTDAGGHRLEDAATRRFFRLMFPEVRAHFESPRQEEHRSTPAGMRTVTLSSDVVPPFGRQDRELSRAPSPYLVEPANRSREADKVRFARLRSQLAILEYFPALGERRTLARAEAREVRFPSSGRHSPALGRHCAASGRHCAALGRHYAVLGRRCAALSRYSPASGRHHAALGRHCAALSRHCAALSRHCAALGRHSPASGRRVPSRFRKAPFLRRVVPSRLRKAP